MLRQFTSAIQSPVNLVADPENAYISTLLVPETRFNPDSFERAFGRAAAVELEKATGAGYREQRFGWTTFHSQHEHSRAAAGAQGKPSNVSLVYVANGAGIRAEAVVKGIRMGARGGTEASASSVSRRQLAADVAEIIYKNSKFKYSYRSLKALDHRRVRVKASAREALRGWVRTSEDEFEVERVRLRSTTEDSRSDRQ